MTIDAFLLKAMVRAGVTAEQIATIAEDYAALSAEKRAEKREQNRIRQQNHRARNALSRVTECDTRDTPSSLKVSPHTPLPNPTNPIPPSPPKGGSSPEFDAWYRHYPHKVGRGQAERAFPAALRQASLETLIEATQRYAAKTDDRPWKNPATWLNGKCWLDAPAPQPGPRQASPPQPPPKPKTIGQMFRDDARKLGLLPDEHPNTINGRVETSYGDGQTPSDGTARLIAFPRG